MRRGRGAFVASVVLVGLVACGGDDDGAERGGGDSDGSDRSGESSTSTTVDPVEVEVRPVIEAREAVRVAHAAALGRPGVNGSHPELLATHSSSALEVVQADAELMALNGWVWDVPAGSTDRVEVASVTFPGGEVGDVAWLRTCEVTDVDVVDLATGQKVYDIGPHTEQMAEVMVREGDTWKLADALALASWDGATECPAGEGGADTDEAAVTGAREEAEVGWLAAIRDPAAASPAEVLTGHALAFFGPDSFDYPQVTEHCPLVDAVRPTIRIDPLGVENVNVDECVQAWWYGHAAGAAQLRNSGFAFAPQSSAAVRVESVTFEHADAPVWAFVETCRTYDLRRTDGQAFVFGAVMVRATEAMQWEAGRWKLAARWGFEVAPLEVGCG